MELFKSGIRALIGLLARHAAHGYHHIANRFTVLLLGVALTTRDNFLKILMAAALGSLPLEPSLAIPEPICFTSANGVPATAWVSNAGMSVYDSIFLGYAFELSLVIRFAASCYFPSIQPGQQPHSDQPLQRHPFFRTTAASRRMAGPRCGAVSHILNRLGKSRFKSL